MLHPLYVWFNWFTDSITVAFKWGPLSLYSMGCGIVKCALRVNKLPLKTTHKSHYKEMLLLLHMFSSSSHYNVRWKSTDTDVTYIPCSSRNSRKDTFNCIIMNFLYQSSFIQFLLPSCTLFIFGYCILYPSTVCPLLNVVSVKKGKNHKHWASFFPYILKGSIFC